MPEGTAAVPVVETKPTGEPLDPEGAFEAFVDRMSGTFGADDGDPIDEGDSEATPASATTPVAGAKADKKEKVDGKKDAKKDDGAKLEADANDEDPDEDTPAEDPAESPDDSSDSDEDEDPADAGSSTTDTAEAADDTTDTAEDDADDEEDIKATLAAAGADVKLTDIKDEYRPLIERKLKSIDAAFTRVNQERTAFRRDRATLAAEEQFRQTNPALYFVEQIQRDPELLARVNAELEKLDVDTDTGKADRAKAFEVEVVGKRKAAAETTQRLEAEAAESYRVRSERGLEVDQRARRLSETAGVPFRIVEKEILRRLAERRANGQSLDIADEDVDAVVAEETREYRKFMRKNGRDTSREVVRARTEGRKSTSPAVVTPGTASSPRPAAGKRTVVDHNNEEARLAAMMRTARRVMPGERQR